ncbi:DUF721 domain-containing protein [Moheibacter sediminis]|uniref:DUF721 domain-containing protein n=1 Tax=Moheibacter sediminis TaxID=1434700 RepID=A0A1W2BFM4_9FLAO|nr:DUF721 domain-containing protein [Moheibacter sediminis]SMC71198.1 Protein of unknown function [Moheibacter sediminis]
MMKRKDNQLSLGDAIKHMISDLGMEDKILSVQIEEIFVEMMGAYIMKYVESISVQKQVLFIRINSPELRNELQYGKSKIIAHINEEIGKEYLKDVKFN